MAKYGSFKYGQAKYGNLPSIEGTPGLTSEDRIQEIGIRIPGTTLVYVDANKTVQNDPFKLSDTENTILVANRDEAIQGADELSTIAMGENADPQSSVSMSIQGLVKITIPLAGSRFSRN